MRSALTYADGTILDTNDVAFWALDPRFLDGDLSISSEVVDNDGQDLILEFTMTEADVLAMLGAIHEYRSTKGKKT